jgi:hypothetical protein
MVYIIYSATNSFTKASTNDILFFEDLIDIPKMFSFGLPYYNNHGKVSLSDFKYIKEIKINESNVFIVRKESDIISNMLNKNGDVDYDLIGNKTGRACHGVILYDVGISKKYPHYKPYVHFVDFTKCVLSEKFVRKRIAEGGRKEREWISVEKCQQLNVFECVDSHSCKFAFPKSKECEPYNPLVTLKLGNLGTIMKPYKLYIFSEFQINPFNVNASEQKTFFKPKGLWFAYGDEWLKLMKKTNFRMTMYNYLYEIEVNENRVLNIDTLKKLHQFSMNFYDLVKKPYILENVVMSTYIDWNKVIKKTKVSGVVIKPNLKELYFKYNKHNDIHEHFMLSQWYTTWDVSSGVLWNKDAITNLKLVYKKEDGVLMTLKKTHTSHDK